LGISTRFQALSPSERQVTYVLLTRPPLIPKDAFDLHVLGTPPAFVLSQDQTLSTNSDHFYTCLVIKEQSFAGPVTFATSHAHYLLHLTLT
jgi:hypothetical protein